VLRRDGDEAPGTRVGSRTPHRQAIATRRRLPIGAELVGAGVTHVRVWAPSAHTVSVVLSGATDEQPLRRDPQGYHSGLIDAGAGDLYQFRLDAGDMLYPDPASRFQPYGPHGPSQIVEPDAYTWSDSSWAGVGLRGQVAYELHIGTFTPEGTFASAARELPELARLGITLVELMPVAEFDGRFGWGYDGVDLFAPSHLYGSPDALRDFINTAHTCGIGVILDVVYNHFGPSGNYLRAFSPAYFTSRYDNEWGDAINFDGPDSGPVRQFFLANAGYWIDEFHVDGLRLDATQQIFDASAEHIVTAIGREARARAGSRPIVLIAENEPQDAINVRDIGDGGRGLDALWNDDFHHSAMVALTGRAEAYYSDTTGAAQEFVSAAKYGFLFQGQHYEWQRHPRGAPALDVDPARFVIYLQNHDQVANTARGLRGHQLTSPGKWRAMTALMLLLPGTPMLFQGQEFAASSPFLYFAEFDEGLNDAVRTGRAQFLTQFPSIRDFVTRSALDLPSSENTFRRCTLNLRERETNGDIYRLHQDLLRLRRETAAFRAQQYGGLDGAVLADTAFVLRFFAGEAADDRLVIVNLGPDLNRSSFAEPLLAPPRGCEWRVVWSSEDAGYGGGGTRDLWPDGRWSIPSESTLVCAPATVCRPPGRALKRRTA
jgi:maltooligosyltrehalose trehalohydrolase